MQAHFDSTEFGSVTINGKKYFDVLVVEGRILERDVQLLRQRFGTAHIISRGEAELLLEGNPAVVIIGNGQSGVLRVDSETKKAIEAKARLLVLRTPEAIEKFNELSKEKRVNALVHTTC